jgi:hypothetical protein
MPHRMCLGRLWRLLPLLGASLLVVACGSAQQARLTLLHGRPSDAASHNTGKSSAADTDMTAAVSSAKGNARVVVKFVLRERPEVGKATQVDLALVPQMALDHVVASFFAEDGLTLKDGGETASLERPEPYAAIQRTLTIVPQRDGIFYVSATVVADVGAESVARTYSIPLIAGAGLHTETANAPSPPVARAPVGEQAP